MSNLAFGLTMTVIGMSITLLSLVLLTFIIRLLNRLYPFKPEEEKKN